MMTAMELAAKISLDSSGFSSSLTKQESAFKKFGNNIGTYAKKVAKIAVAALGPVAAFKFGKSAVKEGMDFDKAMSQVAATMGKSVDEMGQLRDFARQMGQTTAFSATQAAEALNYMALAGYDDAKSMQMLPTVLNLAAAGNIDLASASDMVTDAQSALGLSLEETEAMVDQMAKTSSKTNTSVAQLGQAFLTVGGTAKNLKGGTTELSAVLGVLADNGIKGSEGGTALRNVLMRLSAPTDEAAKKLQELGINAFDADGKLRELPAIFQDFNNATKSMTQQERMQFFSDVFNVRDLKSVEALLGTDMSRWAELMTEIQFSNGAAAEMAETQLDNLAGDVTILKSALSEARITISDKLTPSLRRFVKFGTEGVTRLTNAFKKGGFKAALTELGAVFRDGLTGWLKLGKDASWGEIGKAAAIKIQNGFRGVGVSIKKLLLGDSYTDGATWADVANHLKDALDGAFKEGGLLDTMLGNAGEKTAAMLSLAGEFVKGIANWMTANTGDVVGIITNLVTAIGQAAGPIIEALVSIFTDPALWVAIGDALKALVKAIFGTDVYDFLFGTVNGKEFTQEDQRKASEYFERHTLDKMGEYAKTEAGRKANALFDRILQNEISGRQVSNAEWIEYIEAVEAADAELEELNKAVDEVSGEHDVVFNIKQNGQMPQVPYYDPEPKAKGDWYVPYDNYPALLHRGERVLTASQARHGEGGKVDYIRIGEMIGTAVDSAVSRMGVYLGADRVGDLTSQRVGKNIRVNSNARLRAMGG